MIEVWPRRGDLESQTVGHPCRHTFVGRGIRRVPTLRSRPEHAAQALSLGALLAVVLLGKKRYPIPTIILCLTILGILAVLLKRTYPGAPSDLIALYAVGRYCGRGTALTTAIGTLVVGFTVAEISRNVPSYNFQNLGTLAAVPFAVLAGAWVRTQRTYVL